MPHAAENESQPLPLEAFTAALREAGFEGEIADDEATRLVTATDNSIYQVLPPLVLYPRTRDDVTRIGRVGARPEFTSIAFTARGGGTGTNGQSLTRAVVVDMSRHLNRILEVDAANGRVRVEPGVVLNQLNSRLAEEDLFFPPSISTGSRATLGGMIGTDACGKGSGRYGRTHDYVESLDVVLADGGGLTLRSVEADELATGSDAEVALARRLREVCAPYRQQVARTFPKMVRSLTGYNLRDAFPDDGGVCLQHLFTGAEGTLGLLREATLRVIPRPKQRAMAVVRYAAIEEALEDARTLLATAPSAIETLDERIFRLAREDPAWYRARQAMAGGDPDRDLVLSFVEYEADTEDALRERMETLRAALAESGRSLSHHVTEGPAEAAELWGIRSRSVGLLARQEGPRKPVPFMEDTVVPPDRLPEYIRALRELLDGYGVEYGMFGHVDVGCLHVRPALDMTDPDDAERIREITDGVVALLKRHHGILWGEHGKGFRGEYARAFFGDALYPLLAEVKRAFDPQNRMNPGKIVAPDGDEARIDRIDAVPLRGEYDRRIPAPLRAAWDKAIACNGNGVCFDWDARQAICPSYKITRERIHSPKGRAGLVREWLRRLSEGGRTPEDEPGRSPGLRRAEHPGDFAHAVYDAMQGCLACKACATECPVHVNIPEMRSRFLAAYHRRYRRPLRDHLIGRLEDLAPAAAPLAPLVNAAIGSAPGRAAARRLGLADLPAFSRDHGLRRLRRAGVPVVDGKGAAGLPPQTRERAVFVRPDAFTTYFDPAVLPAVARVIRAAGMAPVALRYRPAGKALHVHGFLDAFEAVAAEEAERLGRLAPLGRPVVGVDPSTTLLYRDEYPRALPKADWSAPRLLQEWLQDVELPVPAPPAGRYRLLLHCTERTAHPEAGDLWRTVFERLGAGLEVVETGCCGMAGTYGHQCEHQAHSRGLYDLAWRGPVEEIGPERVLATGYSCRSQVMRQSGFRPAHPIEVIASLVADQPTKAR